MLSLASTELQDDRDVVLRCVELKPDAIKYASSRLRGDMEIILAALSSKPLSKCSSDTVLNLASTELQDDREVVLHCVTNDGEAIKHASARLRGDKEIILAAEEARANLFQNEIILAAEEARANLEPTFFQNDY